jgi:hypothetical protein
MTVSSREPTASSPREEGLRKDGPNAKRRVKNGNAPPSLGIVRLERDIELHQAKANGGDKDPLQRRKWRPHCALRHCTCTTPHHNAALRRYRYPCCYGNGPRGGSYFTKGHTGPCGLIALLL